MSLRDIPTKEPSSPNRKAATFQTLLEDVAAEHAREVAELESLREENAGLRRRINNDKHALAHSKNYGSSALLEHARTSDPAPVVPGEAAPGCAEPGSEKSRHFDSVATLPASVEWDMHIKPVWLEQLDDARLEAARHGQLPEEAAVESTPPPAEENPYEGVMRRFITYPSSPRRLVWDGIGAVLIFYDLFAIPLIFVFLPPESIFLAVVDWFTLCFWTVDVFLNFFVGYVSGGITHMTPMEIAVRYAKTWLLVDLVVVVPDWYFTIAIFGSLKNKGSSPARLIRVLRLFRMVRLLRLLKLRKIIQNLDELIDSEFVCIFANILKMIVLLLVINHYISCGWFLVGTSGHSVSWVTESQFEDAYWTYQYFSAFHWGITQFTPASVNIHPQNLTERIFAVAVVVFALVGFSYVVGSIAGSLTQLRGMQENMSKQFWALRCYLRQNQVSIALSARVRQYLEHAWRSRQGNIAIDKIPLFAMLSEQLRSELQFELFVPQLSVHPLFCRVTAESKLTMGRMANTAITRKVYALDDTCFTPGEHATHMAFVRIGRLQYAKATSAGMIHKEWVDNKEDWIAEHVLWMNAWIHVGRLTATSECELLLVDPRKFKDIVYLNPVAFETVSFYARNFVKWVVALEQDSVSDIFQGEDVGPSVRKMMGIAPEAKKEKRDSRPSLGGFAGFRRFVSRRASGR